MKTLLDSDYIDRRIRQAHHVGFLRGIFVGIAITALILYSLVSP